MAGQPIPSVRGMNDLLPPDSAKWLHLEARCRDCFLRHGYGEIRTPVLESTALFARGIGETTDIVEKEMYTFADRKGRSLTMRPEMTASCVRAYIEHSVHKQEPVTRWYYIGPAFRYERVQAGRYRQFTQIGVEAFGIGEASAEVEQIAMLWGLYRDLGVPGLDVIVNTVGDAADRPAYRAALVGYFGPHAGELCVDCQRRLEKNPLRILDCKTPGCRAVAAGAPAMLDHLGEPSRAHFAAVERSLAALAVPFRVDARLVRGLDYYSGTVFEIQSAADTLGAQNTVVAGGRYDGLVESLGGPATPAVGFAIGVDRTVLAMPGAAVDYQRPPDVFLVSRGDAARGRAHVLAHALRQAGVNVEIEHRAIGVKAQFKRAGKLGSRFVATLGDDELAAGTIMLRDMGAGTERNVPLAALAAELTDRLSA
jgi:histidyl-tRNA synthetase